MLAELFSIIIACIIFIIAWTTRDEIDNSFFFILGITSFFVAALDFVHTLVYPGMIIIADSDTNLASQFWIAARFMQVLSILGGVLSLTKKVKYRVLILIYTLITSLLTFLIFHGLFPDTFIEGMGLTPFKIISEYVIILIITASMILLYHYRKQFKKSIYFLIIFFLVALIISELCFTLYLSPYQLPNLIGHVFKIIAFYFLYKAIIQIGLKTPVELLFRKLKLTKNKFEKAYNRAEFLMDLIAHDICNILQVILISVNNCQKVIESSKKPEEIEESLHLIENQVREGSNLISNVIEFSRLEDEDISVRRFEIIPILEKKGAQIKDSYQHRDLSIQIQSSIEHVYVYANDLLKEVFENILHNAINHNKGIPLEINIHISKAERNNKHYIKMEFIDNGKGIEDPIKVSLFQEDFTSLRTSSGMGLGLSLVKRIIDLFNGEIRVEDRIKGDYTKGCNFIVLLPEA
jgi:signal transduction histidine kinase